MCAAYNAAELTVLKNGAVCRLFHRAGKSAAAPVFNQSNFYSDVGAFGCYVADEVVAPSVHNFVLERLYKCFQVFEFCRGKFARVLFVGGAGNLPFFHRERNLYDCAVVFGVYVYRIVFIRPKVYHYSKIFVYICFHFFAFVPDKYVRRLDVAA